MAALSTLKILCMKEPPHSEAGFLVSHIMSEHPTRYLKLQCAFFISCDLHLMGHTIHRTIYSCIQIKAQNFNSQFNQGLRKKHSTKDEGRTTTKTGTSPSKFPRFRQKENSAQPLGRATRQIYLRFVVHEGETKRRRRRRDKYKREEGRLKL